MRGLDNSLNHQYSNIHFCACSWCLCLRALNLNVFKTILFKNYKHAPVPLYQTDRSLCIYLVCIKY